MFHVVIHIADTLLHLIRAGHPDYVEWSRSFACDEVTQNQLQNLNQKMSKDLQEWQDQGLRLRKQLYAMNYFTCLQLFRISKEFVCLVNSPDHEVEDEILLLLMSLSQNLTVKKIKEITSTDEVKRMIKRNMSASKRSDNKENHCIIDLESIQENVQLDDAEKAIFLSCVNDYFFNPKLVLAAISLFKSDKEKVIKWCMDDSNMHNFDNEAVISEDSIKLNMPEIDRNDATVQELVALDYSESLSIEAVKTCGKGLVQCINYCIQQTLARSAIHTDATHSKISENSVIHADDMKVKDSTLSKYVI